MARAGQTAITLRITIETPVPGVLHSLQAKDGGPVDPKASAKGEPLVFDVPVRLAAGPRFSGDQIKNEGSVRQFIYVRIGQLAGDPASDWSRRMKIDIHDIGPDLLQQAVAGAVVETVVNGTAGDGTPACATQRPLARRLAART